MKKLFSLIILLASSFLFSQNYHYSSYGSYFDEIGLENILKNQITKIEIDQEKYQLTTAYFNKKGQIEKIENTDKSSNIITSKIEFIWNSDFNYLFSSLGYDDFREFSFMTKVNYAYIRRGDKEMSPVSVTQYWLKNDLIRYAEKYDLYHHTFPNSKSLNGVIEYNYSENNILNSIETRRVTSEIFHNEKPIVNPKHHPQESKTLEFEYDTSNRLKKEKKYFLQQLTSINEYEYNGDLLKRINYKSDYNNGKTEFFYSNSLVTKIDLYTGSNPNPFTSEITYYSGAKKLNTIETLNEVVNMKEHNDEPISYKYIYYKTIVNLNLRSEPSVDSDILIMIPKDEYIFQNREKAKNSEFKSTFEINGEMVTSYWIYTQYDSFKGWVFSGGLDKLN